MSYPYPVPLGPAPGPALGPVNVPLVCETSDLWLKIDQLHLNYLKAEESTKKIEIRNKLEGYIHRYLCLVPQDRKFCDPVTSDVLLESCRYLSDFSALRTAHAFEALERYAANLINQPWRNEFKEIKQYGGFYKHNVESSLFGPERMFHLMGYRSSGQDSLVLDGQVDQDRVTTVARDCILAYVECQIIVSIKQGVSSHHSCTWEEVFTFRQDHVGTPEQAVRSIVYIKNQTQFQNQVPGLPLSSVTSFQHPTSSYGNHVPVTVPTYSNFSNNAYGAMQQVTSQAPIPTTGNLIDLDLDPSIPLTIKHLEEENKRKSKLDPDSSLDSWDYVYKQLENIGYTKDQSERPDVLTLLNRVSLAKQRNEALSPLSEGEKELLRQIQINNVKMSSSSPCDDVDAIHRRFQRTNGHSPNTRDHHKSGNSESGVKSHRHSRPLSPPKDGKKENKGDANKNQVETKEKDAGGADTVDNLREIWKCESCTYNNNRDFEVCEMCGRSRNSPDFLRESSNGNNSLRGSSNGNNSPQESELGEFLECSKCTLQNDRRAKVCEACGATIRRKK